MAFDEQYMSFIMYYGTIWVLKPVLHSIALILEKIAQVSMDGNLISLFPAPISRYDKSKYIKKCQRMY
jgi:hypothetical protein